MAQTLQERFAAQLLLLGETEFSAHNKFNGRHSKKYRVFSRHKEGGFYFLGKSGALRFGSSVSTSIPASDQFKVTLLEWKPGEKV